MKIETKSGIYKIKNVINNKNYIGSAEYLKRRRSHHFGKLKRGVHDNLHLQRSFWKYGETAFRFIVLELCSLDVLLTKEQYYLDVIQPEYNICTIATSSLGTKRTDEQRKNISDSLKGKMKGIPKSEEHRRKLREWHKRRPPTRGTGWHHSEETKRKMSESAKKKPPISEETKEKMRKPRSEEGREKIRIAKQAHVYTPEERQNRSEAAKKVSATRKRNADGTFS